MILVGLVRRALQISCSCGQRGSNIYPWSRSRAKVPIAMPDFTDSVVFDREPLKVDGVWAIVATHPSGQQEHIIRLP
jgi:hypothetical protein